MELTPQQQIFSDAVFFMALEQIKQNLDFKIIVSNNDDWDKELPARLKEDFILSINNDTLEDIIIDEKEEYFTVFTEFDGELYEKNFYPVDIQGFADDNMRPIIMKNFKESHPPTEERIKGSLQKKLDNKGLEHSMKMFKRNNPEMFNE